MANTLRLEQLFRQCDTSGSGLICCEDFQDLCAGFGIEEVRVSVTPGQLIIRLNLLLFASSFQDLFSEHFLNIWIFFFETFSLLSFN